MKEYLLKEIANVKNGYAFDSSKYSDKGIPIIRIADIKDNIDLSKCVCIDEEINKEFLIKKGSLLIALSGATTGKMAVFSDNKIAYLNQRICSIYTKNEDISQEFLIYFLKSIQKKIIVNSYGGAQPNISSRWIENIKIKAPNIEIQKKISKKLELLENNIKSRKSQLLFLNELNKSLFTTMFGDIKTNDKNWKIDKFNKIISILTDYHANGSYKVLKDNVELLDFKEYALMIRTTDLENDNFIQGVKYINEKAYNFLKKTKIFGGEIIINKIGSAGNVYLMPILNRPVSLGMNQFMIRLKEDYNNIFYYKLLKTDHYNNIIKNNVQGAVTKTITKDAIKNIDVIIPPIELQNKFAEKVEKIEKLSFEIEEAIKEVENLYNSLISKYFD